MNQSFLLIRIFFKELKNSITRIQEENRIKVYFFTAIGLGFAAGIYFFFHWMLSRLNAFEVIGPILMEKLLFIIFLTFLIMLVFSNIITGLSTYYLSNDLSFLFSSPLEIEYIFDSKFFATILQSSWTILVFGIPVLLAYGTIMKSGWYFYPLIPVFLVPFLFIPAGIGVAIIILLVQVYPVKKVKEITFLLSIAFAAVLVIYFRFLQPERLVNPEGFSMLADYLAFLKGPSSPYLPSYWISTVLLNTIRQNPLEVLFYFLVMLSSAGVCYILSKWIGRKIYYESWTRSQSKVSARPVKFLILEKMMGTKTLFRALLLKDTRLFWRDVTQWSQIILFFAIGAIYIFNLRAFRLQTSSTTLISFINLGFTGFVIAATGVRFSFPAISLEGKAFWIMKAAPCSMKTIMVEKFWTSFIPLLTLGETLIITSNILLKVNQSIFILGIIAVFFMTLSLTALAVGMGAIYPQFKADNPAEIGGSGGGILYMILALGYVGLMILLLDWQVISFLLFLAGIKVYAYPLAILISVAGVLLLNFSATCASLKNGLQSLNQFEWK